MYAGLVARRRAALYDGNLRFVGPDGHRGRPGEDPLDYATHIGEAAMPTRT
jgi:hypothetical protein